ncbi:MAG: response regulator [Clostridia bacterium]|nr:response regulator [Clostridia bacterium]
MHTVVVVDDEPITRMDVTGMLLELGYDVVGEAADGFDAVSLCQAKHPDVVLMDVNMPIFDGLTASDIIITENLAGCVVLLTAFNDDEIIDKASKIGVTGYLVKPVEQRRIKPAIEVALAQSEKLRASKKETEKAQKQLEDSRLIARAQAIIAKKEKCTESEAYAMLRSMAMDKRVSMAVLAKAVLNQEARQ